MTKPYRIAFIAILILAGLLRLGLALVNREANDNHLEAVRMIMESGRLPVMFECRECFHPKLYYASAAALLQVFRITDVTAQTTFLQLLNVGLGLLILAILYKFIREYPVENDLLKQAAFTLIALNPKLIALNAQASNDTFSILFSTLALYLASRFLKASNWKYLALLTLVILLAVSTKVTGWISFVAICLSLLLALWVQAEKARRILGQIAILLLLVVTLTTLNPLSQWVTNTQKFGLPLVTRDKRLPFPPIFTPVSHYKDYYFRPGIVSLRDGFFTFKLAEILEYPLITNSEYNYPPQRTSFWTMLYADAHSLHFQNWPESWQTQGEANFTVSRGIFLLALLPTLIFVAGFLRELFDFIKALLKHDREKVRALHNGLFLLTTGGYLAFLMLITLLYRDFAFIKFAYILPGLLAFAWIFLRGAELLTRFRWGAWLLLGWATVLSICYICDVTNLIWQLYTTNIHF